MARTPDSSTMGNEYRFQLLRYAPNPISGEFFNIAVMLYDAAGSVIGARFASDLKRLACNPAVEMDFLLRLRDEFEEQVLLGEGAADYLRVVQRHLSSSIQVSDEKVFWGGDPTAELDRLQRTYTATPSGLDPRTGTGDIGAGSRAGVRRAMQQAFDEAGLFRSGAGFRRGVELDYTPSGLTFEFDYGYATASGRERLLHSLGARNDLREASRLCFVYERVRNGSGPGRDLTTVLAEGVSGEALQLLESSEIEHAPVGDVNRLAEHARTELGLS